MMGANCSLSRLIGARAPGAKVTRDSITSAQNTTMDKLIQGSPISDSIIFISICLAYVVKVYLNFCGSLNYVFFESSRCSDPTREGEMPEKEEAEAETFEMTAKKKPAKMISICKYDLYSYKADSSLKVVLITYFYAWTQIRLQHWGV